MKPDIDRISSCDSHVCRATGAVLAHDQVDSYATRYNEDGQHMLLAHLKDVLLKLATVVAEDLAHILLRRALGTPREDAVRAQIAQMQPELLADAFKSAIDSHIANAEKQLTNGAKA